MNRKKFSIPAGVVVASVVEDGPAAQAGIQEGDIITELDGRSVSSIEGSRIRFSTMRPVKPLILSSSARTMAPIRSRP